MQLPLRDAARLLGVEESTLLRWAKRGEIASTVVHEQYRFDHVDLMELATARGLEVQPDALLDEAARNQPLPRLIDAVRAGGVHRDVPGADKVAALREVVERLPVPAGLERPFLLQMLLAREQLGSTGFGHGIALPHPRYPIVLRVAHPSVSVCFLARPVDFDAVDGQPVHTLFTLVTPSVRVHLHLLALLGAALRDGDVLAAVAAHAPDDELFAALERVEAALAARRRSAP